MRSCVIGQPIGDGEFATREMLQGVQVFHYQWRHRVTFLLQQDRLCGRCPRPARIEKHVSHDGGADQITLCVGQIDASDTEG